MSLANTILNTFEVFVSKVLFDSYINQDSIVSVNNMLRKYNKMEEENKRKCFRYKMERSLKYLCRKFVRKILQTKILVLGN